MMETVTEDPDFLSELIPFRCPKCGNIRRFPTLRELKLHLQSDHSYKTNNTNPRIRSRLFNKERDHNSSDSAGKEKKNNVNMERSSSPLLQSFREDAAALEIELQMAKQNELRNKAEGFKYLAGKVPLHDFSAVQSLNREVLKSRENQWKTADALYKSHDILLDMESAAERRYQEQREIIQTLVSGMKTKEKELTLANKEQDDLRRERERLLQEAEELFRKADENNECMRKELKIRGKSIDTLNSELETLKSKSDNELMAKDIELQQANQRMQHLESQRHTLVQETDTILKKADEDNEEMKIALCNKEEQLRHVNIELDKLRWEQQSTLEQCIQLYRKADEGSSLLKNLVQTKDSQLTEALQQLNKMKAVQARLLEESEVLTQQADENSESMKRLLKRKEDQLEDAMNELGRLKKDQDNLKKSTSSLAKKTEKSCSLIESLQHLVQKKEKQIQETKSEYKELETFLHKAADKERAARAKLEVFIGELIDRADKAETELHTLKSQSSSSANEIPSDIKSYSAKNNGTIAPEQRDAGCSREKQRVRRIMYGASDIMNTDEQGNETLSSNLEGQRITGSEALETVEREQGQEPEEVKENGQSIPGQLDSHGRAMHAIPVVERQVTDVRTERSDNSRGNGHNVSQQNPRSPGRKTYRQGDTLSPHAGNQGEDPNHDQTKENFHLANNRNVQKDYYYYYEDDDSEFLPSYIPINQQKKISRNMPMHKQHKHGHRSNRPMSNINSTQSFLAGQRYGIPSAPYYNSNQPVYQPPVNSHIPGTQILGSDCRVRYLPRGTIHSYQIPIPPMSTNPASRYRQFMMRQAVSGRPQHTDRKPGTVVNTNGSEESGDFSHRGHNNGQYCVVAEADPRNTLSELGNGREPKGKVYRNEFEQDDYLHSTEYAPGYFERRQGKGYLPSPNSRYRNRKRGDMYRSSPALQSDIDRIDMEHSSHYTKHPQLPRTYSNQPETVGSRNRDIVKGYTSRSRSLPPGTGYRRMKDQLFTQAWEEDDGTKGPYPLSGEVISAPYYRAQSEAMANEVLPIRRRTKSGNTERPRNTEKPDSSSQIFPDFPGTNDKDIDFEELEDGNFQQIMDDNGIMWDDMDTLPDVSDSEFDRVSPSGSEAAETRKMAFPVSAHGSGETPAAKRNPDRSWFTDSQSKVDDAKKHGVGHQTPRPSTNDSIKKSLLSAGSKMTSVVTRGGSRKGVDTAADQDISDKSFLVSEREKEIDKLSHFDKELVQKIPTNSDTRVRNENTSVVSPRTKSQNLSSDLAACNENSHSDSKRFRPITSPITRKSSPSDRDLTSGGQEVNDLLRHSVQHCDRTSMYSGSQGSCSPGSRYTGIGKSSSSEERSVGRQDIGMEFDEKLKSIAAKYSAKRKEIVDSQFSETSQRSLAVRNKTGNVNFIQIKQKDTQNRLGPGLDSLSENSDVNVSNEKGHKYSTVSLLTDFADVKQRYPDEHVFVSETSKSPSFLEVRRWSDSSARKDQGSLCVPNRVLSGSVHTITADVHPVPSHQVGDNILTYQNNDPMKVVVHDHSQTLLSEHHDSSIEGGLISEASVDSIHASLLEVNRQLVGKDTSANSTSVLENLSMFAEPIDDTMSIGAGSNTQSMMDQASSIETDLDTDTESRRRYLESESLPDLSENSHLKKVRNTMSSASSQG